MTTFDNDDVQVWTCPECHRAFRVLKANFSGRVLHHCGAETTPTGMRGAGDLLATVIKVASGGMIRPCTECEKRQSALNRLFPFKIDKTNPEN